MATNETTRPRAATEELCPQFRPDEGHAPGLPARDLTDIHQDASDLAGLLYVLDHFDPTDRKGINGVACLKSVAARLANKLTNDLEEVM